MEFILSIISSLIATILAALSVWLWNKIRELKRPLKLLGRTKGTVPDISGKWFGTSEAEINGNEVLREFLVDIKQYGRAIEGRMIVPDKNGIEYEYGIRGAYDGNAITAYYWSNASDTGDVGSIFLKYNPILCVMDGSYTGVTWDNRSMTKEMSLSRSKE